MRRPMQGWSPNSRGAADQDTYGSVIRADTWHSSSTSSGQLRRMRRVPAELAGGARTGCVSHPSTRMGGGDLAASPIAGLRSSPFLRLWRRHRGTPRRRRRQPGLCPRDHLRCHALPQRQSRRHVTAEVDPAQMRDSPACVARLRSGSSSDACQTAGSRPGVRHRRRAGLQRAVRAYAPGAVRAHTRPACWLGAAATTGATSQPCGARVAAASPTARPVSPWQRLLAHAQRLASTRHTSSTICAIGAR